jgi:basic membrane protein A
MREMQSSLGLSNSQILNKTNIPDADQSVIESSMRECIAKGANIIIATSWGFMDACEKLSAEYPRVVFAHATGYKYNDVNFTNYFGRMYQARYLGGIVAGLRTQSDKIGFVAAMGRENSEVTGGINAFAMGVESVRPEARIYVKVTHNWFDPAGEALAARDLISYGCDVIAQHCNNSNPQVEAQAAGVWSIGFNSDMSGDAPDAVITSVIWRWGAYYKYLVKSVIDGTFTTAPYFGGIDDGIVDVTPINEAIAAPGTAEIVESARDRIIRGELRVFDGEMETNDGWRIGAPGSVLPDSEIISGMNWYYRNVMEL